MLRCYLAFTLIALQAGAWAATRTVTSTADSGAGTLRDTIAASSAGDVITFGGTAFTAPLSVTIRLTSGRILVDRPVTINGINNGRGATKITLSGDADNSGTATAGDSGIFQIASGSSAVPEVRLYNLKFESGRDATQGGAIFVASSHDINLDIERCTFTDNAATGGTSSGGAISWRRTSAGVRRLILTGCNFTGNAAQAGGAVFVTGKAVVTCTDCRFTGNAAVQAGGAINILSSETVAECSCCVFESNTAGTDGGAIGGSSSPLAVSLSTFSGNTAGGNGGAIHANNSLDNADAVSLTNCTLSGNTAGAYGGGLSVANVDACTLNHCTVTDNAADSNTAGGENGGGIAALNNSAVTLRSSIVAGNVMRLGLASDCGFVGTGLFVSDDGNVIRNADGSGGAFVKPRDLAGTTVAPVDPRLGPLASNGGGMNTRLPHPASPAVNRGGVSSLATDQRGLPRHSSALADSGAVELQFTAYADWAQAAISQSLLRGAASDPDKDGIPNLLEYLYGTGPVTYTPDPLTMERTDNTLTLRWPQSLTADPADYNLLIQQSSSLSGWQPYTAAVPAAGEVSGSAYLMSLNVPVPPGVPLFLRLRTTLPLSP